jgi:Tol biopolymer transport system component
MSLGWHADFDLSTRRGETSSMHCRRLRLVLLAAIAAAASSSAGALSQAAPDAHLARAVRGSILVTAYSGVYRRDASGALTQLTKVTGPQVDLYPVWSRAGTRIAFERERLNHPTGGFESCSLMVMNSDGSDLHQVGQVRTDCSGASWGPNDDRLVFGGGPPGANGATLRVVNLDGTGLRTLLRGRYANPPEAGTHPTWSPDGRTVVFGWSAGPVSGLLAIRPDGTHLRALVRPRPRRGDLFAQPSWSRDGKRLAFFHVDSIARTRTITVSTSSGLRRHALARLPDRLAPPGGFGGPSWSTNDSLIAFPGQCRQQACVWTIPSGGGIRQVLIRGIFVQPNWGPAGP